MHAVRKDFIEAEASEKLRSATKTKTRDSTGIIYQPRYIVYYKQSDSYQWKGPGAVSEHENKHISETQWGLCKSPCMLFTACLKLKMTSKKENIESVVVMSRTKMNLLIYKMIVIQQLILKLSK